MIQGKYTINSRQRILNAMNHLPVDHTPLYMRFWPSHQQIDTLPFNWRNQFSRARYMVAHGLDDILLIQPPMGYIEDYDASAMAGMESSVHVRQETDDHCVIEKRYQTPAGELQHTVRLGREDWIYGNDIYLFSDYNVPRATKHIINGREDIKKLKYLLKKPNQSRINRFRLEAATVREEAQKLGVAVEGGWCALGDAAVTLCGMERVLEAQMEDPEFLEELLDTLLEWELMRADLLLDAGIDILTQMAWYEGVDFWTPGNYRSILAPRIRQLVDAAHSRGAKYRYILTKGVKPLMEDIISLGIDCITGIDPVQDNVDLAEIKSKHGGKICMMGGINSAVMLTQHSDEQICAAVSEALRIMSPGSGFILFPVDAIFNDLSWEKICVVAQQWRECEGITSTDQSNLRYSI